MFEEENDTKHRLEAHRAIFSFPSTLACDDDVQIEAHKVILLALAVPPSGSLYKDLGP